METIESAAVREYHELRHRGERAADAWRLAHLELELAALEDAGAARVTLEQDHDWRMMAPCTGDYTADRAWIADVESGRLEVLVVILERRSRCPSCGEQLAAGWETIGALGGVDVYAGDPDEYARRCALELLAEHRDAFTPTPPEPCRLARLVGTLTSTDTLERPHGS